MLLKKLSKKLPPLSRKKREARKAKAKLSEMLSELAKKSPESGRAFLEKGLNAKFLKSQGFSARVLRENFGLNTYVLRELNFSVSELFYSGFSPLNIVLAGFGATELKEGGIGVSRLRVLGARKLLNIGFTVMELEKAGVPKKLIDNALKKIKKQPSNSLK